MVKFVSINLITTNLISLAMPLHAHTYTPARPLANAHSVRRDTHFMTFYEAPWLAECEGWNQCVCVCRIAYSIKKYRRWCLRRVNSMLHAQIENKDQPIEIHFRPSPHLFDLKHHHHHHHHSFEFAYSTHMTRCVDVCLCACLYEQQSFQCPLPPSFHHCHHLQVRAR